jgi:hypothetical protein
MKPAEMLPHVYDKLRKLAAAKLASEKPGHTLDATALVHEAYLRLVGDQHFDDRGHFFAAAAEAMRRILVNHACDRSVSPLNISHGEDRCFFLRCYRNPIFKTLVIPFDQVNRVAVANPYRGWWRLKLDWADFCQHVVIDKTTGRFRHLAFTPDDPETFRATLEAAVTRFRERLSGKE